MRKILIIVVGLCLIAMPALAFHDAGVAHCNGCHTMHNSQNGDAVDGDSPGGNAYLLVDATPSDVCLGCHADHLGAVFSPDPMAPLAEFGAGDFTFLKEDNLNDGHAGASHPITGDAAGHNLIAPSMSVAADATLSASPGGAFPASIMGCTSCHDPHGNTNFRLLYGSGKSIQGTAYTFTADAPDANGISIFFGQESNSSHTAYVSGMSEWCGNCHGDFHNDNLTTTRHPSGQSLQGIADNYNEYMGTTDLVSNGNVGTGDGSDAYLAAVPFEDAAATTGTISGPGFASKVMCLSCHRAHASSAPDAGRWDFSVTLLDEDGVESSSYAIPNPYDSNQRSLCNKCHMQDKYDHITP